MQTVLGVPSPFAQPPVSAPEPPPTQPMAAPPDMGSQGMKTMLGFSAPNLPPPAPTPPPAQQPVQALGPVANAPLAKTMLGFAVPPDLRALQAPQAQPAQPPAPQPQAPPKSPVGSSTLLGVAMPGIAPIHPPPFVADVRPAPAGGARTLLGVAAPGIAPMQPGYAPPQPPPVYQEPLPPIVPAPAPLSYEAAPMAPAIGVRRRGIPLAAVAGLVSLLLVVGCAIILLVWRGRQAPLATTARIGADGKELLHLTCANCPDGTTATVEGTKATFQNKEVDIQLASPLTVGDNKFDVALDRPGRFARNQVVKVVLPITYRIRGDVSEIGASPPVIKVLVEAQSGLTVTVDGKPVALDASRKATVTYEVSAEVNGFADDVRMIERKIPYTVEGTSKHDAGDVSIRVGIVPLRLDAPGLALVTDADHVDVAGRTAKGAQVTFDGTPMTVAADGTFDGKVDLALGDHDFIVRASAVAQGPAPRTAQVHVKRTRTLAAEAAALEKGATLGGDALIGDPGAALDQPIVIEGRVVEARTTRHQTVLLVEDKRGCTSSCVVRVVYGADAGLRANDTARAYGRVGKPYTATDGKVVPVVDASLLFKAGR